MQDLQQNQDIQNNGDEIQNPQKTERGKKSKVFWIMILIIGLAAAATWGYQVIDTATQIDFVDEAFNILVVGVDYNYQKDNKVKDSSTSRSDTLMLIMIPKDNKKASVVSIPRDTLASVNGSGRQRINSAFPIGGIDLTKKVVEDLTGVVIDRYVILDFDGFQYLVDAIGGVEIDVDKRMKYTDNAGGTYIDLKPGLQVLNGEQALGYVRFRYDALGDISRVDRQQKFMKALANQLMSWNSIKEYKSIKEIADEYTVTDLTFKDLASLGRRFLGMDLSTIETYTLPGHFKDAYWEPEPSSIDELMASILSDGTEDITPVNGQN